jgi:hypothetical protein
MNTRQLALATCTVMILSAGSAYAAGPCNTGGKDAGSGPTPGATGQSITTGAADTKAQPPTDTMNRAAGDKAMSAQDAQRQQQGEPTAAQQAQGGQAVGKNGRRGLLKYQMRLARRREGRRAYRSSARHALR